MIDVWRLGRFGVASSVGAAILRSTEKSRTVAFSESFEHARAYAMTGRPLYSLPCAFFVRKCPRSVRRGNRVLGPVVGHDRESALRVECLHRRARPVSDALRPWLSGMACRVGARFARPMKKVRAVFGATSFERLEVQAYVFPRAKWLPCALDGRKCVRTVGGKCRSRAPCASRRRVTTRVPVTEHGKQVVAAD